MCVCVELLVMWKPLFYCMWMSDKLPVQNALANTLSDLIFFVDDFEFDLRMAQSFIITINREWAGIDR